MNAEAGQSLGIEKSSEAQSKIVNADVAKESSDLKRGQILQQHKTPMPAQTNDQAELPLKSIG